MYKMDGRLKPADKKETAELRNKTFSCKKCKILIIIPNVEFAERVICCVCGEVLQEV